MVAYMPGILYRSRARRDPTFSNVVLLCNFNDDLLDVKGHTLTNNGSIALSSTQSRYGTNSAYFNGSTKYFTIPDSSDWYFNNNTFTVEYWWYPTSSSSQYIISQIDSSSNSNSNFVERFSATNTIVGGVYEALGAQLRSVSSNNKITINAWNHIAHVVDGTTASGQKKHKLFVNGTGVSSLTTSYSAIDSSQQIVIGKHPSLSQQYLSGYINGLRIKTSVEYWTDFTPSTDPWPES